MPEMTRYQRDEKVRNELRKSLSGPNWCIAATFTFKWQVSEAQAQKAMRFFWCKVDKALCGKSTGRHGKRCERACFLEMGSSGEHAHYHAIIGMPEGRNWSEKRFCQFLTETWHQLHEAGRCKIEPAAGPNGWLHYITKEVGHSTVDAWDVHTTHIVGR